MTLLAAAGIAAFGCVVGVFSALFGVGGGGLMVPFMVLVLGTDQHLAEGTSLLAIVPTAVVGVYAHRRGGLDLDADALWLAAGGAVGALAGARAALSIEPEDLQRGFGLFLVAIGIRFVISGRRGREEPPPI